VDQRLGSLPLPDDYLEDLKQWRASLDASLRAENSWLALAGLIWLEDDQTPFGAAEDLPIHLKLESLADQAGIFIKTMEGVRLHVLDHDRVRVDDQLGSDILLRPDTSGQAQRITIGHYSMMLIERGERLAIRLWNNALARRSTFPGRQWYPGNSQFRIKARFVASLPDHQIEIPNELGEIDQSRSPGYLDFEYHGHKLRLDTLEAGGGGMFVIFKDQSTLEDTYGSGRFLITASPEADQVLVDFNQAFNPPCAFTRYATCPLPPQQNWLPVSITAGERKPIDWD
jgi:uncharacterized protein (DUF1684 family)